MFEQQNTLLLQHVLEMMMMLLLLYVRGCGVTEVEEILWSHQFIRQKKAL